MSWFLSGVFDPDFQNGIPPTANPPLLEDLVQLIAEEKKASAREARAAEAKA